MCLPINLSFVSNAPSLQVGRDVVSGQHYHYVGASSAISQNVPTGLAVAQPSKTRIEDQFPRTWQTVSSYSFETLCDNNLTILANE